ncbi:MAG: hypothetical protein JWR38_3758 [Mucilaginibacter sp.]|nr:hypothetical protein [Mucilaginibacter sp.]
MKKIRNLQILVYLIFGLLIIQNGAMDVVRGFKDGLNDSRGLDDATPVSGPALSTVIEGDFITHGTDNELKVGNDYTLQNINIYSDVKVKSGRRYDSLALTILKFLFELILFGIIIKIAVTINKIILNIAGGTMFEPDCIKLVTTTGIMIALYSLIDYVTQLVGYYEQKMLIHLPMKVVNTSSYDFGILICAILVFILAEAFKQGARLKEEQALTI